VINYIVEIKGLSYYTIAKIQRSSLGRLKCTVHSCTLYYFLTKLIFGDKNMNYI
jgi:hypothetical protein